jgi:hypothetical protein
MATLYARRVRLSSVSPARYYGRVCSGKWATARRCESSRVPTIAQVEEQILVVEGFRVRLTPLLAKTKSFPSYEYLVMAPQRWRISDWKAARLGAYLTVIRSIVILRGDGSPVKPDLQLGNLRDSYYADRYGTTTPQAFGDTNSPKK